LRKMSATLMGPAPCVLSKKARSYRYHIIIKATPENRLGPPVQEVLKGLSKTSDVKVSVDVNPSDTY